MTTINDDRVLDARDMAEEVEQAKHGDEAITGEMLRGASDTYAAQVLPGGLPRSFEEFEIQLKLAFSEGALWYNQKQPAKTIAQLGRLSK